MKWVRVKPILDLQQKLYLDVCIIVSREVNKIEVANQAPQRS